MKPSAKLYDLPETLVIRKPFALGRDKYAVGDVFNWKKDGVKERRVQQMWDQRWVGTPAELARDQARWEAKKNAEKAGKKSAHNKSEPTEPNALDHRAAEDEAFIEAARPKRKRRPKAMPEPVTAEDYDL